MVIAYQVEAPIPCSDYRYFLIHNLNLSPGTDLFKERLDSPLPKPDCEGKRTRGPNANARWRRDEYTNF